MFDLKKIVLKSLIKNGSINKTKALKIAGLCSINPKAKFNDFNSIEFENLKNKCKNLINQSKIELNEQNTKSIELLKKIKHYRWLRIAFKNNKHLKNK